MAATGTNTTMTIRTNKEIKDMARDIYSRLGIDLTTAVNVFLRQSIRYKGFPFDVNLEVPNSATRKALGDALNEDDLYGPFETIDELMEDLDA